MMPLHYAAKMNDLQVIKTLLATKHKLNEIKDANQPYLFATDPTCKIFLFQYWKRELLFKNLLNLIQNRSQSITSLQVFCNSYKSFSFDEINEISHRIIYIQTTLEKIEYDFSTSLHHLLQIFNTIDVTSYIDKLKTDFNKIVEHTIGKEFYTHNKFENSPKIVVAMNLLMMFYPLLWVIDASFFIKELCNHAIEGIDDLKMIETIRQNIEKQESNSLNTFKQLSPEANKHIIHFLELPQSIYSQVESGIIYIGAAKITGIHSKASHVFQSQFSSIFRKFFSNSFSFPRSIPFNHRQLLIVIVTRDFVTLLPNDKSDAYISLPISLMWSYQKNMFYKFMTPVGRFDLRFANDSAIVAGSFLTAIKNSTVGLNVGQSHFQKKKDRLFQCLISYAVSLKDVQLKVLIVKAGDKAECDDICREHLKETVNMPVLLSIVMPMDITDSVDDLIII